MRWQLTRVNGALGSLSAAEALAKVPMVLNEQGQGKLKPIPSLADHEVLWARVQPELASAKANWLILPHDERQRWEWWQARVADLAEIGFGRAAVALALGQLNRLGVAGRLIAVDQAGTENLGVEGILVLDWTPAEHGLAFELSRMDGRLDGKTDIGALLAVGRNTLAQPEVLFCPGIGADGYLERLLPFFSELGLWASSEVRWEFAEADLGRLGVVGSLFNWAWLVAGYRLGDWAGPIAVIELDESPLAGLSIVNWTAGGKAVLAGLF